MACVCVFASVCDKLHALTVKELVSVFDGPAEHACQPVHERRTLFARQVDMVDINSTHLHRHCLSQMNAKCFRTCALCGATNNCRERSPSITLRRSYWFCWRTGCLQIEAARQYIHHLPMLLIIMKLEMFFCRTSCIGVLVVTSMHPSIGCTLIFVVVVSLACTNGTRMVDVIYYFRCLIFSPSNRCSVATHESHRHVISMLQIQFEISLQFCCCSTTVSDFSCRTRTQIQRL